MKKSIAVFILLIYISIISCHREDVFPQNTTISGQITDNCTGKGLKCMVSLNKDNYHPSVLNAVIKQILTDDDGNFKIKFYAEKGKEYNVSALAQVDNSTLEYTNYIYLDHIKRGDNIDYSPKLTETSTLAINYKDVNPYNSPTDSLYCVVTDNGIHNTHTSFTAHGDYNYGVDVRLMDCFPLKVYLNWDATKNNITTHHIDSINCSFTGQTVYNLKY